MTPYKNGIDRRSVRSRWREFGLFLLALSASFVCVYLATSLGLRMQRNRDIPATIQALSTANYREGVEVYFDPVDIAILSEVTADTSSLLVTPENRGGGTTSEGTPVVSSFTPTNTFTPIPIETATAVLSSPTPTGHTSLLTATPTSHLFPTATPVPATTTPNPPTSTTIPPTSVPPTKTPKPRPKASPTATATPNNQATATSINATSTTTATPTEGIFASVTPTPSATTTIVLTVTPTPTPSHTPPATTTLTPSITYTPTPSSTPTHTPTPSPTPSATTTLTPTITYTPTPSSTPTHTPTPTITPTPAYQPIIPIFVCQRDSGNGTFTAYFGYQNLNAYSVNIPVGSANRFTPPPDDRGQPTDFSPGITSPAVAVVYDGSALVWHLDGINEAARNIPCPLP